MPQIFVTGVERSGASLAAAVLKDGLSIPLGLPDGSFRSPRSGWMHETYEDDALRGIFAAQGADAGEAELRDAAAAYVAQREAAAPGSWAVKSCAFGPLLPALVAACDAPIVIDVWRSPAAVIASWQAATDCARPAADAWYLARRAAHESLLAGLACPVVSIGFETILDDPSILAAALAPLGVTEVYRADRVWSGLRPDLVHFDAVGRWIPRSVGRKLGPWGTVAVAVRTYAGPTPEFFSCYQQLLSALRPGDGALRPAANLPAHWAADSLARAFLNSGADSLFMMDDDMTFKPDDLNRLRDHPEGHGFDMLSAFATRRQYPPRPITMRRLKYQPPEPMAVQGVHYAHIFEYPPEYRVFDADMTGLAFTLIRREVFEAMIGEWGPAWTSFFPFVAQQSDDAQFCVNLKAKGGRIGVCLDVKIGHVGTEVYGQPQLNRWLGEVAAALEAVTRGSDAPTTA